MYDAREVANFLLDYADARGVEVSNMALLKHIYFAHGWHLAGLGAPLISNRIEAWEYGPVVRAVYDAFKRFGSKPVTGRATYMDWNTGEEIVSKANLSDGASSLVRSTFDYYAGYGAFELSDITHSPGGPWYEVWHRSDGRVVLNMEIANDRIRTYFASSDQRSIQ